MNTKKIKSPIKTSNGKWHLKEFVISNFPEGYEQLTYVEPFCSGANVFLNKIPSQTEVISDADQGIIAVFKALRDEPKEFISRVKRTKYTERSFKIAANKSHQEFEDYIDLAVNEFILRKMSRAGLKKTFVQPEFDEEDWDARLEEVSVRIQKATVVCKSFVDIIRAWDEVDTLFYFGPPFLKATTDTPEPLDLSVEDHMNLIHLAKNARGKVIISGYSSPLYNRSLKNWKCKKKPVTAAKKDKRVECVWINY